MRKPDADKLDAFLIDKAKKRGYYLSMGITLPLRELLIWQKEEMEVYSVELPCEFFSVNVVFTQGFLSHGWLGYATFNKKYTGGWNIGDTIYHVGSKASDNNEWFRVSLLGHEGRHISDRKLYGTLDGWILEYRAKLTELLLADVTFYNLLRGFINEAHDDVSIPHSYASYRLVNDLINGLTQEKQVANFRSFHFEDYSKERIQKEATLLMGISTTSLEENKSMQ